MFTVCGEALWDLFAIGGSRGDRLGFDARPGGSALNVAIGLGRLGQPAALLSGLSTDPLGQRLAASLRAEGVATGYLVQNARPTTISVIDLDLEGVPAYAIYGDGAADRAVQIADLPEFGADVWGVHAASFALVVEPIGTSLLALFRRERPRRFLTLDPNVRLGVQPDVALWRRRIDDFCRLSDVVKLSSEDLALLYPGAHPETIARKWLAAGAGLVVLTRGAAGAAAYHAAGSVAVPARTVRVADTVGAGDAFQAALIAGLAERGIRDRQALDRLGREAIAALLDHASAAAAIACTRRGAEPPYRDELPPLPMEIP